jgi:SAM-dependent methyltransferase
MRRSRESEIIDDPCLPECELEVAYRDLTRTHRWLGNTSVILAALERDPFPVGRVLDIGCGHGGLLLEIRKRLGAEIVGVDLRAPSAAPVPIMRADAVREALPVCDVAIAVCLAHHLAEDDLVELIRNVGRSSRRFILLDLVRHRLPLVLFRLFVAPFVCSINAADGARSIRRSYTPRELSGLVRMALAGSSASFRHSVAPLYARQVVDIRYM